MRHGFSFRLNLFFQRSVGALIFAGLALPVWAWAGSGESFDDPVVQKYVALPRNFPSFAEKGRIRFTNPPEVKMDGKPMLVSPAARIRDERNMSLHMSQLKGKAFDVMYVRDPMQQFVSDIWILTDTEKSRPTATEMQRELLRMQGKSGGYVQQPKIDPMTPFHKQPKYKY